MKKGVWRAVTEIGFIIFLAKENVLTPIAALDHMMRNAGNNDTRLSRHADS